MIRTILILLLITALSAHAEDLEVVATSVVSTGTLVRTTSPVFLDTVGVDPYSPIVCDGNGVCTDSKGVSVTFTGKLGVNQDCEKRTKWLESHIVHLHERIEEERELTRQVWGYYHTAQALLTRTLREWKASNAEQLRILGGVK